MVMMMHFECACKCTCKEKIWGKANLTGGMAAHPAERALHLPERRQDDRLGCARGGTGVGMTEISGVPAYNPRLKDIGKRLV